MDRKQPPRSPGRLQRPWHWAAALAPLALVVVLLFCVALRLRLYAVVEVNLRHYYHLFVFFAIVPGLLLYLALSWGAGDRALKANWSVHASRAVALVAAHGTVWQPTAAPSPSSRGPLPEGAASSPATPAAAQAELVPDAATGEANSETAKTAVINEANELASPARGEEAAMEVAAAPAETVEPESRSFVGHTDFEAAAADQYDAMTAAAAAFYDLSSSSPAGLVARGRVVNIDPLDADDEDEIEEGDIESLANVSYFSFDVWKKQPGAASSKVAATHAGPARGELRDTCVTSIYDVSLSSSVQKLNEVLAHSLSPLKFGGIFHAGVEISSAAEWSYGYTACGTGVHSGVPTKHPCHHYRETLLIGQTFLTREKIASVIDALKVEYKGGDYHLVRRNCCHFASDLCSKLGAGEIPGWIQRIAWIGESVLGMSQGLEQHFRTTHLSRSVAPPAANQAVEEMIENLQSRSFVCQL
eukprot:CAMPEP_0115163252 /NCGR_PEP_ID=MMETSP0227-20121206/72415_1 /TAXON_ID=89957 /ORGANISM="Polarella glacialis, Strain CCMP 1383" /LENGTH=472 /DNA_ID=CAMNT_0002575555 /DNA_START=179 /DNA_END=1599 /DNA_ORIENTATION=-